MDEKTAANKNWPEELRIFVELQERKCDNQNDTVSPGWVNQYDPDTMEHDEAEEIEEDKAYISPSEIRRIIGIIRKFKKKHEHLST